MIESPTTYSLECKTLMVFTNSLRKLNTVRLGDSTF
jgi:hypothetical protein